MPKFSHPFLLLLLLLAFFPVAGEELGCKRAQTQLDRLSAKAQALEQATNLLQTLMNDGLVNSSVDLQAAFSIDLEDEAAVAARLKDRTASDILIPAETAALVARCPPLTASLPTIETALQASQTGLELQRQAFLQLPQWRRQLALQDYRDQRWLLAAVVTLGDLQQQLENSAVNAPLTSDQPDRPTPSPFERLQALGDWRAALGGELERQQQLLQQSRVLMQNLLNPAHSETASQIAPIWQTLVLQGPWPQRQAVSTPFPAAGVEASAALFDHYADARLGIRLRLLETASRLRSDAFQQDQLRFEGSALTTSLMTELAAIPVGLIYPFHPAFHLMPHADGQLYQTSVASQAVLLVAYLLVLMAVIWLAVRSPKPLDWSQRWLNRQQALPRLRLVLVTAITMVRPNAVWLSAWMGFSIAYGQFVTVLPFVVNISYPLLMLYVGFRLIMTISDFCWGRVYRQLGLFLIRSEALRLHRVSRSFAGAAALSQALLQVVQLTAGPVLIYNALLSVMALLLWALWVFCARNELAIVQQAACRTLPSHLAKPVAAIAANHPLWMALSPLALAWVLIMDLLLSLHRWGLSLESYQRIAARILRFRLETTAVVEDDSDDSKSDASYEKVFLNQLSDENLIDLELAAKVRHQIDLWLANDTEESVLLLTGDKGAGKSTLCRQLAAERQTICRYQRLTGKGVSSDDFWRLLSQLLATEISSVEQLLAFDRNAEKTLVIIDEAQNLFLSEVGHFQAYRQLCECLNEQFHNLFWLLAFNSQSWNYLRDVFGPSHLLADVVRMPRWSQTDIRNLIIGRHQKTGFRLNYNELLLSSVTAASSESEEMQTAEGRLFNLLWDQAGGNPGLAIRLWLSAATRVGRRRIEIGLPPKCSVTLLRDLPDQHHFVLAAIAVHENLKVDELEKVTNLPASQIRNVLKNALSEEILSRDSNGRYQITIAWYPALITVLTRKNHIHG